MASYYASIVPVIEGGYSCQILDFPPAITQADTLEEAIELLDDLISICAEEYTRERRKIPTPSSFEEIKRLTLKDMQENADCLAPNAKPFFQLMKLPNMEVKPVKVTVSLPKNILEQIDKKANNLGMTRSGFIANSAMAYNG